MQKPDPDNVLEFPWRARPAYKLKLDAEFSASAIDFREDELARVQIHAAGHFIGAIELNSTGELVYHPMDGDRKSCYKLHTGTPFSHMLAAHPGVALTFMNRDGLVQVNLTFSLNVDPPELLFYTTQCLARTEIGDVRGQTHRHIDDQLT